jgi:hypothetical protein
MPEPASTPTEPARARVKLEITLTAEVREVLPAQAAIENRTSQGVVCALLDQHLTDARRRGEVTRG